jgi:CDP-glycerol glycerophosphotransferase
VERTRYGHASIAVRGEVPVIDGHSWTPDGRLTLSGRYAGLAGEPCEAVLSRKGSTERHVTPMARDGERFTITIDAAAMPAFGRRLPLRDGFWLLGVRRAGRGDELITPAYEHGRLAGLRDRRLTFGPKSYCFTTTGYDTPILIVAPALKLTEHGRVQRKVLRSLYYPVQQRLPLRDAVLFISWKGKQCSDNPRGIAEELRRRGDTREHIWVVNDWAIPVPDGATAVLAGTEDYYEAVARSAYLITNDDMQDWYVKRDGQVYVQTWHGTPLKRIGFDVSQPQFISGTRYLDHLARDVAKWDLLLSPNPFSTPILRQAFRYEGEIGETGYPRNDVLCGADADRVAARVRATLGIPAGKRVIMYAPTWRDNQYYASGRYRFDFRLDLEQAWRRLGEDHVILLRGHHHMADDVPAGTRPGFVINVTDYPDISELFLATDAVITDYSSVMFDFAPTGRPILFFTYDLEEYRDELRGFYFDLEAEAPGPLLATSAEVIEAIANLDAVAVQYRAAYHRFAARFCPLDDGKAAARACDRIFGG